METRLLIFAGLVMLSICSSVIAAPTVSGVSGTISEGSTITITGSGFGPTGPNVILFDDFEKGTDGQAIKTGAGSAEVGMWSNIEGQKIPRYSNAAKVSGSLAFRADMAVFWRELIETPLPQNTREIFISWWIYLPAGTNIPGEGTADQTNWKNVWIQGAGTVDDDITLPTFLPGSYAITGNDGLYTKWIDLDFRKGSWKHLWSWISVDDGLLDYWELTDNGVVQRDNARGAAILKDGGAFERVDINGYGRETPNCFPMFDDIYIASNPARIEIGNKPTYEASTKLTIFTGTSWSGSQVQSTARLGQFKSGEQAYLYVFDSSNSHNAAGYPITIGSGSSSAVCGNGIKEGNEQCDDGNTVTESCSYGQTSCTVCSASCQRIAGATSYCGDKKCDAGETTTSCSQDCGIAAGPSIASASGTMQPGSLITLSGSGFGMHPSYNEINDKWQSNEFLNFRFKDFEDASIASDGFSIQFSANYAIKTGGKINSLHYGSASFGGSDERVWHSVTVSSKTGSYYVSFDFMVPAKTQSGKLYRFYYGPDSSEFSLYTGCSDYFLRGGSACGDTVWSSPDSFNPGTWHKVEVISDFQQGKVTTYIDGTLQWSQSGWLSCTQSPVGHTMDFPNMIDETGAFRCSEHPTWTGSYNYDDIFIDFTQSRVLICAGSTWTSRGRCEPQLPVSWSTGRIDFMFNKGAFSSGQTGYVYIVESSGKANTNGHAITVAGSVSCTHAADNSPCDGCVSNNELISFISIWKSGTTIQLSDLMEAIRIWKQGC